MAWRVESEHVDLAEMRHRTIYVETELKARDGGPVRHTDDILLGPDGFSSTRGFGSGNLVLAADGTLKDPAGNEIRPADRQKEMLARLEAVSSAGRAYARKHNKPVLGQGQR